MKSVRRHSNVLPQRVTSKPYGRSLHTGDRMTYLRTGVLSVRRIFDHKVLPCILQMCCRRMILCMHPCVVVHKVVGCMHPCVVVHKVVGCMRPCVVVHNVVGCMRPCVVVHKVVGCMHPCVVVHKVVGCMRPCVVVHKVVGCMHPCVAHKVVGIWCLHR